MALLAAAVALLSPQIATWHAAVREAVEFWSWAVAITIGLAGGGRVMVLWAGPGTRGARVRGIPALLQARALHLVKGRLPRVSEVTLVDLRVKRAIESGSEADRDLPPYVARTVDEDLLKAVAGGGMVLLHGPAAAGKTRTAAEAIRRVRRDNRLLIPRDGTALRELIETGHDFGEVVVWLDDLERFLSPDGLDLALLQRLCRPKDSAVLVIATIRDEELARFNYATTAGRDDSLGIGTDLLRTVQGSRRKHLLRRLTEQERSFTANQAKEDDRVARALKAQEGFGEHLAAGVAMLEYWTVGDGPLFHSGQAIISAAVDCRRAGFHDPVPQQVLARLQPEYVDPGWLNRADLASCEDAVTWACRPVLQASSCLQPRGEGRYIASDYLVDRAEAGDSPLGSGPVSDRVWQALQLIATPRQAMNIGIRAYLSGRSDVAEDTFRMAVHAKNAAAMKYLGLLRKEAGDVTEAERWFHRAADNSDTDAMVVLGGLPRCKS
ncbi:hypothetical protein [Amycolatopsis sp. NPDC051071]|uniref:hypothetical protein n=1 Tax=Amycolatopsis sp. NPDC051071 TaxID=3154637 RepID=UPI00343C9372